MKRMRTALKTMGTAMTKMVGMEMTEMVRTEMTKMVVMEMTTCKDSDCKFWLNLKSSLHQVNFPTQLI